MPLAKWDIISEFHPIKGFNLGGFKLHHPNLGLFSKLISRWKKKCDCCNWVLTN